MWLVMTVTVTVTVMTDYKKIKVTKKRGKIINYSKVEGGQSFVVKNSKRGKQYYGSVSNSIILILFCGMPPHFLKFVLVTK